MSDKYYVERTTEEVESFYRVHSEIKESHGINHVMAVYRHAENAVQVHAEPTPLTMQQSMQVLIAALLHDVDDHKYFPQNDNYENARIILDRVFDGTEIQERQQQQSKQEDNPPGRAQVKETIIEMISFVSCSMNKNSVPDRVKNHNGDDKKGSAYWMLIPRWADRLEAVGRQGVVRCYQYNREHGEQLSSEFSPRPQSEEEVWEAAHPERFERYDGNSTDMISHYYDKLLHVSRPPPGIVRNVYLESMANESSKELVEVCLRYGRTGLVDERYIQSLH
jgi:uncharacterized protein